MSLIKRAGLYIARNRGKTVLLLIIIVILSSLVLIGMSVNKGSDIAMEQLRKNIGGYFKVKADIETMDIRFVDDEFAEAVASKDGVTGYNTIDIYYLITPDLELIPARFTGEMDPKAQLARFISNRESRYYEYFVSDIYTLAEGRHIEPGDRNKAVISDELAEMNGIGIGDTITAKITEDVNGANEDSYGQSFEWEVVGKLHNQNKTAPGFMTPECDVPENFIFTDAQSGKDVISAMSGKDVDVYKYGATFFTDDPRQLGRIIKEALDDPNINWDGLSMTVMDQAYRASAQPLEKLGGITTTLIMTVFIISIVLLSLILTMWMKDRVRETGIYMSVGIKKGSIFLQHFLECILIAVIAFCIALGIATAAAGPVGNMVLDSIPMEEVESDIRHSAYDPFQDAEDIKIDAEKISNIDIQVGPGEFGLTVLIGIAVITASVGLSSISVFRMKPKEILTSIQ